MEQTLVIIKPDAVTRNLTGKILAIFEEAGLHIVALKREWVTKKEAEIFYAEHRGRPFFEKLTEMTASSPIVPVVLCGDEAISRVRSIMGTTDPAQAAEGTIRQTFGQTVRENSVHGSDCAASAAREIAFFFSTREIVHEGEAGF